MENQHEVMKREWRRLVQGIASMAPGWRVCINDDFSWAVLAHEHEMFHGEGLESLVELLWPREKGPE